MTTRRRGCWRATGAAILRKFFSTLRAAAARRRGRRCVDNRPYSGAPRTVRTYRARSGRILVRARGRHGGALLVLAALVLAARVRPDLLADRADVHVGVPADLHRSVRRAAGARRTDVHWRSHAVGHFVPRPARVLD